jgi:hypothetical protein
MLADLLHGFVSSMTSYMEADRMVDCKTVGAWKRMS